MLPGALQDLSLDVVVCGVTVRLDERDRALAGRFALLGVGAVGRSRVADELPEDRRVVLTLDGRRVTATAGTGRGTLDLDGLDVAAGGDLLLGDALVRAAVAHALAAAGGVLLHAAAVPWLDGAAVVFGRSGAGKSTVARALGPALADELTAVRRAPGGWMVEGTPWWAGPTPPAPLARLVWLVRGEPPGARPVAGGELARALLAEVGVWIPDAAHEARVFALAAELAGVGGLRVAAPEGDPAGAVARALG